jgi:hypothetical protein
MLLKWAKYVEIATSDRDPYSWILLRAEKPGIYAITSCSNELLITILENFKLYGIKLDSPSNAGFNGLITRIAVYRIWRYGL